MTIVLPVTTAATAMQVSGSTPSGLEGRGRALGGGGRGGVDGGGEREGRYITPCPPPPRGNWHLRWQWQ
jgi:hypothetical protein